MFRQAFSRPLRRYVHSQATRTRLAAGRDNFGAVLAATAVTGTYFAWRINADSQHVALDSDFTSSQKEKKPPLSPKTSETVSSSLGSHTHPSDDSQSTVSASDNGEEEQQGGGGGAFNPATGEINWDCPCLGGMAHGICGGQFREAFSCFVFSEAEPKGIDCVAKFKAMQDCFREHPDVYGEDIMADDDDDDEEPQFDGPPPADTTTAPSSTKASDTTESNVHPKSSAVGASASS